MKPAQTTDFLLWALTHVRPDSIPEGSILAAPRKRCGTDPWEYLFGASGQACTQELLRHARVASSGFDLSANGFNASGSYTHIDRGELQPADILHRDGHVGMFVGGDYAVEWMGGAYGCQLTKLSGRKGYSFVTKRTGNMGAWQNFLRPRFY